MPESRDDLKTLSTRLVALHAALVDYARQAYEETHGPTQAAELLQLLLNDRQFTWLRPLSGIIAQIDETLDPRRTLEDTRDPNAAPGGASGTVDAKHFFDATQRLLRSGEIGPFQTKYREALQRSPDIVMAHANVVKILGGRAHGA